MPRVTAVIRRVFAGLLAIDNLLFLSAIEAVFIDLTIVELAVAESAAVLHRSS